MKIYSPAFALIHPRCSSYASCRVRSVPDRDGAGQTNRHYPIASAAASTRAPYRLHQILKGQATPTCRTVYRSQSRMRPANQGPNQALRFLHLDSKTIWPCEPHRVPRPFRRVQVSSHRNVRRRVSRARNAFAHPNRMDAELSPMSTWRRGLENVYFATGGFRLSANAPFVDESRPPSENLSDSLDQHGTCRRFS